MMVHVVLNGCADSYESQAKQINGFLYGCCGNLKKGTTYIIGNNETEKQRLLSLAPTTQTEFLWVKDYQPETVLNILEKRLQDKGVYLFGNDAIGSELAVRMAVRLKGASCVNVSRLEYTETGIVIEKPIYSNHCLGRFLMKKSPCCLSIAKGTKPKAIECREQIINFESYAEQNAPAFLASREWQELAQKTIGLEEAEILLVAGRGVKNKEAVEELEGIANRLSGHLGVSRPGAMNAWAPMDRLVGVSGAMLAPKICIATGVSGAAAFFAGIEKSDFIVAINTDERAPIMKKADIAIVGDYLPILQALMDYME